MAFIKTSGLSGASGLVESFGLGGSSGLFQKGLNEFHPNELDPYLLFDARDSMIGTLENPTLDLDPSKPDTLNVITATRAGVATYTDAAGVIQSADPDTVRVDYVDGVPMILVEPTATNLLPYSEDFSHAGWTKYNDVAVTSSSVNSPDGTTNAFKITGLESTDGDVGLTERVGASASTTYTFSAYFKALGNDDVGKKIRIRLKRNGGALVSSNQQVVLSSEWVRHSVTITLLSDNTGVDITISKDGSSPIAERTDECLIYGAQLEEGSVPTSYIPTSGGDAAARTRAADDLVIDGSDFTDFFNTGGDGTFFVTAQSKNTVPNYSVIRGGSNSQLYVYTNDGSRAHYAYDGGTGASYSSVADNQLTNFAISYNASTYTISKDGSNELSESASGDFSNATELEIGSGYSTKFNGHIKRLIYWPYHSDNL